MWDNATYILLDQNYTESHRTRTLVYLYQESEIRRLNHELLVKNYVNLNLTLLLSAIKSHLECVLFLHKFKD